MDAAVATESVCMQGGEGVNAAVVIMGDPEPKVDGDKRAPCNAAGLRPTARPVQKTKRFFIAAGNQRPRLHTVALRPPMIWGAGMPMLDQLVQTAEAGKWQWIDGGAQKMSTCHVDNLVAALLLAATAGENGQAYFMADGAQGTLKSVIGGLLATRGIQPGNRSVSFPVA
ncbi:hypothetical protein HAQ04_09080 [Pseudomonas sp. C2L11]|nr:hypothetical protein [Pseudomonas typographi]